MQVLCRFRMVNYISLMEGHYNLDANLGRATQKDAFDGLIRILA